jgi:hypothetical protein
MVAEIVDVTDGLTATVVELVAVDPNAVTATVYKPDCVGVTLNTDGFAEEEVNPPGPVQL